MGGQPWIMSHPWVSESQEKTQPFFFGAGVGNFSYSEELIEVTQAKLSPRAQGIWQ